MTAEVYPQATFLIDFMGDHHLHVVLYDRDRFGQCVLAPISSIKKGRYYDPACVLHNVDHEWLKKLSYVVYGTMLQTTNNHVHKMIAANIYIPKDRVEDEVFKRIVNGLFNSDDVSARVVTEARRAGLKPG